MGSLTVDSSMTPKIGKRLINFSALSLVVNFRPIRPPRLKSRLFWAVADLVQYPKTAIAIGQLALSSKRPPARSLARPPGRPPARTPTPARLRSSQRQLRCRLNQQYTVTGSSLAPVPLLVSVSRQSTVASLYPSASTSRQRAASFGIHIRPSVIFRPSGCSK